jgi:hypothetical protein
MCEASERSLDLIVGRKLAAIGMCNAFGDRRTRYIILVWLVARERIDDVGECRELLGRELVELGHDIVDGLVSGHA